MFTTVAGLCFGGVPVAWSTWLTRIVPDEAESGGGLIVAAVQLAITLGAALGVPAQALEDNITQGKVVSAALA